MKAISVKVLKDKCWLKDTRAVLRVNLSDGTYTDTLVCPVSYDGQVATFEETVTVPNLVDFTKMRVISNNSPQYVITTNGIKIISTVALNPFNSWTFVYIMTKTSQIIPSGTTCTYSCDFTSSVDTCGGRIYGFNTNVSTGSPNVQSATLTKTLTSTSDIDISQQSFGGSNYNASSTSTSGSIAVGDIMDFQNWRITADPRPSFATYVSTVQILSPDKEEVLDTVDGSAWLNGTDHTINLTGRY